MNAILKKLSLIIAFSFVAIVLSLIVYAIVPSDTKFEQIWATDNKQYERAYATLATNDESVIGVLTLAYTLREVHSKYPLVILVSHQVTEPYLRVLQHPFLRSKIVIIEKIEPPSSTKIGIAAWREALTKLKIWTLTDYKKVMYLDADQIILQNIDEWFDRPTLTGTVNQDISCVPAAEKTSSQGGLNAALLIFEPNITVYYRLIKLLNNGNSWGDSDQGIISHYFESVESSMHLLPMPETTFARCCHAPWFNRTLLRVVHFTHFALNYQKVAAEMQEEPHLKNWDGIPNCDSDFYIMWKRTYHRVMAIVNEAHDIREIKERRNPFWMLIAFTSIMGIVYLLYTRRSQSSSQ